MLVFHDPIPEIAGRACRALTAQEYWHRGALVDEANVLFLQLEDGVWHRFFIDAGVVFWKTVDAPSSPPDNGNDRYPSKDIGARHGLTGRSLRRVGTVDLPGGGELRLEFDGGPTLILRNVDDCSSLVIQAVELRRR